MSSKQSCPTVPPLYTWDSGTRGCERDSKWDKPGTGSLKSLALAVLSVPPERDKRDNVRDKGEKLVPRAQEALGQKSPQKEKVSLEKYDTSTAPATGPSHAVAYLICASYPDRCRFCPAAVDARGKPYPTTPGFCRKYHMSVVGGRLLQ